MRILEWKEGAQTGEGMKRMKRCTVCKAYTLDDVHCGAATASPHPPKYSVDDRYAAYRRDAQEGKQ